MRFHRGSLTASVQSSADGRTVGRSSRLHKWSSLSPHYQPVKNVSSRPGPPTIHNVSIWFDPSHSFHPVTRIAFWSIILTSCFMLLQPCPKWLPVKFRRRVNLNWSQLWMGWVRDIRFCYFCSFINLEYKYGIFDWGSYTNVKKLLILQKRAIWIIWEVNSSIILKMSS